MFAVVGAAVMLVALPGLTNGVGRRLAPKEWSRLCATALAGGLGLLEAALVLRAAPPVLRAAGFDWLASACDRALGPLVAGGPAVGWAAGIAATGVAGAAVVVWRGNSRVRRRVAADLWLGERRVIAGHQVVVLPVTRPVALSFEHGRSERVIVLSTALLATLDPAQVEAVVRHEAAHLRHRHQRLLTFASVAEQVLGWVPAVERSVAALRLALERWADEEASCPSAAARRAVRDSLLSLAGVHAVAGVAGFAEARTVAARVVALESPPPPPSVAQHAALYVPGSGAGALAGSALLSWGGHVQMVVAMSGRCPI